MKVGYILRGVGLASVVLLVALGSASAKDQWFVLGEKVVKSMDPSADIKAEEGKDLEGGHQEDLKQLG